MIWEINITAFAVGMHATKIIALKIYLCLHNYSQHQASDP